MQDGPNSKPSRPEWLALAALILLSFLIRLPRMEAVATAHTWLTSHTVLITRIWQMTGLSAANYSLVTNWPNQADRYTEYGPGSVFDAQGNTYFLSFPPLAFYLSYAFFNLTGQGASLLALRLLMWIAGALGGIALWRTARSCSLPADAAAAVFLLSPVSLYYFGTGYFPLILAIPLWMALVMCSLQPAPKLPLVAVVSFTLCFMDWLGYLAILPLAIVALRRRNMSLAAAICLPPFAALALTLITYSSIAGWAALWEYLRIKFLIRSGLEVGPGAFSLFHSGTYYAIFRNYYLGFAPVACLLLGPAIPLLFPRGRERSKLPDSSWTLLFCLTLPVVLEHALLVNHTANHRYAVLKAAPAIGVALAMCPRARPWRSRYADAGLAAAALVMSIWMFYRLPLRTDPYVETVAQLVQYQVGLDRVLFLERDPRALEFAEPSLLLLTERNFHMVDNVDQAKDKLKKLGLARGLYVRMIGRRPPRASATVIDAGS